MTLYKRNNIFFLLFLILISCNESYTPKPIGYNRIEFPKREIQEFAFSGFTFQYPDYVRIDTLQSTDTDEVWFNIVYPQHNATIHCTYLPINRKTFLQAVEDSYHLSYSHSIKADGIEQEVYSNPSNNVSGIIYNIEGEVATPIQFFVTDSTRNFLRGSFYYSVKVNVDSVMPVTDWIKEDISLMLQSFRWNDK